MDSVFEYLTHQLPYIEFNLIGVGYESKNSVHVLGMDTLLPLAYTNADIYIVPQRYSEMTNELAMALELNVPLVTNTAGERAIQRSRVGLVRNRKEQFFGPLIHLRNS